MITRGGILTAAALASVIAGLGCIGEVGPAVANTELRVPVRAGFEDVADGMQPSCGTLDCHGQVGRNLRLVGERGLRLSTAVTPGEGETTPEEYEANYWSLVALEPELLSSVVASGGQTPERLMLVRKGRGTTRHKGGALMPLNGQLDQCIVGWLKGSIPGDACSAAAKWAGGKPPP